MGEVLDYMENEIEDVTFESIIDLKKQLSEEIVFQAQKFLNTIRFDMQKLKELNDTLIHQRNAVRGIQQGNISSSYEYRTQIQNRHLMTKKDYYREIVSSAILFQTFLNEKLKQRVELVYVYQDSQGNPYLYSLKEEDLFQALSYQINKGKISGRFRQTNKFLQYLKPEALTKYQLYENFNLEYFNYTYKQVIWRYDYGKLEGGDSLILWLNPNYNVNSTKWLKAKVGATGDIKQAYASVLLDRSLNSTKLFNNQKLDNNVHSFMQEVAKVDDESGLLKGDVTVQQIEYAIKGSDAQTLGLSQIITYAESIIDKAQKSLYSQEDIRKQKQEFHDTAKTRNHIKKMVRSAFDKKQREFAKQIQAKNTKAMSILINFNPGDEII